MIVDHTANVLGTEFGSTLLAVGGIQWLKKSKWFPLLKEGQAVVTRFFSLIIALAVSVGISYTWNPQQGTLLISGLNAYAILHGLFHWAEQYIYQETGYNVYSGLTAMQEILQTIKPQENPKNV